MKLYKVLSGATVSTLVVVVATVTVTLTTMMMILATATTTVMVSAYTFDPLNNMWKPSGAKTGARRSSSFASSFAPHPSEVEAPPVFEEEVIRAQYSTWAGHYHNGINKEHGESFQQKSLVQIEYNKRTGEVSLVDHDGIITKEDYQNLMRAISTGNANDAQELKNVVEGTTTGLDVVDEDVTLGTTHFVDGEDIDPNDVIDTSSQEVQTQTTTTQPQPTHHATTTTEYHHHHHHQHHHHHHEEVVAAAAAQTFQTYAIPQTQLQDQQYQQLQQIQHHQQHHYQHPGYSHSHSIMTFQPQMQALQPQPQGPNVHTTAVADSVPETTPQNGGWGFNDRRTTFIN
ncbi:hypothetical protein IV203_000313 [Nitzschia inconspicua]|uniref:EF-hand domain-containing protein n=1 Tax=Nitzschia inconspicua TaxID=303405 RepID=A0A9K3L5A0_9STRA|nr:hypothetical protein IV203_000313 [Nitzschia inconspicua]